MAGELRPAMQAALIGIGAGAEKILLPALNATLGLRLVAACDLDADRRAQGAGRWQIPQIFEDATAMLAAVKPDLLVIATPPQTHYEMACLGLEHGCHLYCEKPFTPTLATTEELLALAERKNRLVAVNNQYYQMPIFHRVQDEIDSGRAGRLFHIHAWQQMYLPPHEEGGWKQALRPRRVLLEFGTHAIDLICRFYHDYPVAVSAQIARPLVHDATDICVTARLDFPDHRVATLTLNRMSRAPLRYFEMRVDGADCSLRASLGGLVRLNVGLSRGQRLPQVRFSLTTGGETRRERNGWSRLLAKQRSTAYGDAAAAHLSQFVADIRAGRPANTSPTHIRAVMATMSACYESAESGGVLITLPPPKKREVY